MSRKRIDPYDFASDVGSRLVTLAEERERLFSDLLTRALGATPPPIAVLRSLWCTARFALETVAEQCDLPFDYYSAFMNGSGDAFNEFVGEPDSCDETSGREFWNRFKIGVILEWNRAGLEPFARHVGLELPEDGAGLDALLLLRDAWVAKEGPVPLAPSSTGPAPALTRHLLSSVFMNSAVTDENRATLTTAYDERLYLDCWHHTRAALDHVLFSKPDDPYHIS